MVCDYEGGVKSENFEHLLRPVVCVVNDEYCVVAFTLKVSKFRVNILDASYGVHWVHLVRRSIQAVIYCFHESRTVFGQHFIKL